MARLNIENSELRTELDHSKQELLSVNAALEQNKLKARHKITYCDTDYLLYTVGRAATK